MPRKKLTLSVQSNPLMTITRSGLGDSRVVYVILANKSLRYNFRTRSRIAYIGTTKNGIDRVAESAANIAGNVLKLYGVTSLDVHLVKCTSRKRIKTWHKLERAMLLAFRAIHGEIPKANTQGKNFREIDEFQYFSRERVRSIIRKLGEGK